MVVNKNQLVIVALPAEDDPVLKFSSETAPHLTLLYLGENKFNSSELTHVTEYIEHASSQFHRFHLEVESRGVLGDKNADVLFFNKRWAQSIAGFRQQLLADPLISQAYLSIDQFPDWTPHLTMGYPTSPAKKDTRDYANFSYVDFNRIALWTEDSAGPTFQLKQYDSDLEVAMSQIERGRSAMDGVLQHYGVKGMRWGVRRSDAPSSRGTSTPRPTLSEDAKTANRLHDKIATKGTGSLSNQEMRQFLERMDLERRYSQTMSSPPGKSVADRGHEQVKKYLAYGQTYENVRKFLDTDTGKAIKTGLKVAATAGAAYATGGSSAAARVGTGLAVRSAANHFTNVGF
jgi:2'-5' RNA ligase